MSKIKPAQVKRLVAAATAAQRNARCGFSHFPVGAAVLGASGRIYPGCNIESPTLIYHICAERTALFNAIAAGERKIKAVCTVSRTAYPCGACRQAILEFAGPLAPIYSVLRDLRTGRKILARTTAAELLPHAYTPRHMKSHPKRR